MGLVCLPTWMVDFYGRSNLYDMKLISDAVFEGVNQHIAPWDPCQIPARRCLAFRKATLVWNNDEPKGTSRNDELPEWGGFEWDLNNSYPKRCKKYKLYSIIYFNDR